MAGGVARLGVHGRVREGGGLANRAPNPGLTICVTGGGGYIGCVLVKRLLDRGHRIRVVDCLHWGDRPLAGVRDRIEIVAADIRELPATALDGVDAVIHLAGLSNDSTAEYDPEANWRLNALATESLGEACVERGIERFVFASSCSLYDGLPPGMHDEETPLRPCGAYATSKRFAEERLLELADDGLRPVILRNGTAYGWSPRMRFDLLVNTFVKDALAHGRLELHGGGWMWRPVIDVRDIADAMIAVCEAPLELVGGETFNVLHSNHQIRELAMLVAGSVQMIGREVRLEESPAPPLTRDYRCANAKLTRVVGFTPIRSVAEAVADLLGRIDLDDRAMLTDPRHYNIEWAQLHHESGAMAERLGSVLG